MNISNQPTHSKIHVYILHIYCSASFAALQVTMYWCIERNGKQQLPEWWEINLKIHALVGNNANYM